MSLTLARNESWAIGFSLRALLQWVDHGIVLLHACEDATPEIVATIACETGRVTILEEPNPAFDEMDFRQRMLDIARDLGATHIASIDADEVLSANLMATIRSKAAILPPRHMIAAPLHNLWRSLDQCRNDGSRYGCNWAMVVFRDAPDLLWKAGADGYQFHHRAPFGVWHSPMRLPLKREDGGLLHLQHAAWRRMLAKHAAYQATEVVRWSHRDRAKIKELYTAALDERDIGLMRIPSSWWPAGLDRDLIDLDATPWHEAELRRLVAEHGQHTFTGLDLFGLA